MKLCFVFLMFFSSLLATPCKIILIRHGETDWNVQKKSQGWKDIPLNEKGRLQAEDLRIKFSSLDLKTIYTSSLLRALETAEIIGKEQNSSIISDPAIRFYRKDKKKAPWYKTKKRKQLDVEIEIATDATTYFKQIAKNHPGETVLVVTHQAVIRSLYKRMGQHLPKAKKVGNGRILHLLVSQDSLVVQGFDESL